MAAKEFVILYTHQKTKKKKTWHDGVLKISEHGHRAVLYDDSNTRLDALYVKPNQAQSLVGEDLESDKYLITVEEEKRVASSSDNENTNPSGNHGNVRQQRPVSMPPRATPMAALPLRQPLKRRRTGFTVPRQAVIKKPVPEPEPEPVDQSSSTSDSRTTHNAPQATQPSLFNTPFSGKPSNSHKSFFNLYGKNSSNTSVASQSSVQCGVSDSFPNSRNVQSNSNVAKDDRCIGQQSYDGPADQENRTDDFEESFEPACFDVATPSITPNNSTFESQLTEFDDDDESLYTQTSFGVPQNSSQPPATQNQSLVQSNNNEYDQTSHRQCNVAVTGKRSASQILALLGRSKGAFKPPVKESAIVSTPSKESNVETLTPHSEENSQLGRCSMSRRMPCPASTDASSSQRSTNFEVSQECRIDSTTNVTQQRADDSSASSVHHTDYSFKGKQLSASNQRLHAGVESSQQLVGSSNLPSIDHRNIEQRPDARVGGGLRNTGASGSSSSEAQDRPCDDDSEESGVPFKSETIHGKRASQTTLHCAPTIKNSEAQMKPVLDSLQQDTVMTDASLQDVNKQDTIKHDAIKQDTVGYIDVNEALKQNVIKQGLGMQESNTEGTTIKFVSDIHVTSQQDSDTQNVIMQDGVSQTIKQCEIQKGKIKQSSGEFKQETIKQTTFKQSVTIHDLSLISNTHDSINQAVCKGKSIKQDKIEIASQDVENVTGSNDETEMYDKTIDKTIMKSMGFPVKENQHNQEGDEQMDCNPIHQAIPSSKGHKVSQITAPTDSKSVIEEESCSEEVLQGCSNTCSNDKINTFASSSNCIREDGDENDNNIRPAEESEGMISTENVQVSGEPDGNIQISHQSIKINRYQSQSTLNQDMSKTTETEVVEMIMESDASQTIDYWNQSEKINYDCKVGGTSGRDVVQCDDSRSPIATELHPHDLFNISDHVPESAQGNSEMEEKLCHKTPDVYLVDMHTKVDKFTGFDRERRPVLTSVNNSVEDQDLHLNATYNNTAADDIEMEGSPKNPSEICEDKMICDKKQERTRVYGIPRMRTMTDSHEYCGERSKVSQTPASSQSPSESRTNEQTTSEATVSGYDELKNCKIESISQVMTLKSEQNPSSLFFEGNETEQDFHASDTNERPGSVQNYSVSEDRCLETVSLSQNGTEHFEADNVNNSNLNDSKNVKEEPAEQNEILDNEPVDQNEILDNEEEHADQNEILDNEHVEKNETLDNEPAELKEILDNGRTIAVSLMKESVKPDSLPENSILSHRRTLLKEDQHINNSTNDGTHILNNSPEKRPINQQDPASSHRQIECIKGIQDKEEEINFEINLLLELESLMEDQDFSEEDTHHPEEIAASDESNGGTQRHLSNESSDQTITRNTDLLVSETVPTNCSAEEYANQADVGGTDDNSCGSQSCPSKKQHSGLNNQRFSKTGLEDHNEEVHGNHHKSIGIGSSNLLSDNPTSNLQEEGDGIQDNRAPALLNSVNAGSIATDASHNDQDVIDQVEDNSQMISCNVYDEVDENKSSISKGTTDENQKIDNIETNLKGNPEVLDHLLNTMCSQNSTATSVDTMDFPLTSDQNLAAAAKIDAKLSQILSDDDDWAIDVKMVDDNRDGMVPESPTLIRGDVGVGQSDDVSVPEVRVADRHPNVFGDKFNITRSNNVTLRTIATDSSVPEAMVCDVHLNEEHDNTIFGNVSQREIFGGATENALKQSQRKRLDLLEPREDMLQCVPEFMNAQDASMQSDGHNQDKFLRIDEQDAYPEMLPMSQFQTQNFELSGHNQTKSVESWHHVPSLYVHHGNGLHQPNVQLSDMSPTSDRSLAHNIDHRARNSWSEIRPNHSDDRLQHGNKIHDTLQTSYSTPPWTPQLCHGYPNNESRTGTDICSQSLGACGDEARVDVVATTPQVFGCEVYGNLIGQGNSQHEELDGQRGFEKSMETTSNWMFKTDVKQDDKLVDHKQDTLTHHILPHPEDMKMNIVRKAMKHSLQTDTTSFDKIPKGSKKDKKKMRYWRKPVSSEKITRGPIKPTHDRAVARRQDVPHAPTLAYSHLWDDSNMSPNMKDMKESSTPERFGLLRDNDGGFMQCPTLSYDRTRGGTEDDFCTTPQRSTLKYDFSPTVSMQDYSTSGVYNDRSTFDVQPQRQRLSESHSFMTLSTHTDHPSFNVPESSKNVSPCVDREFLYGHVHERVYASCMSENTATPREFCLTPLQGNDIRRQDTQTVCSADQVRHECDQQQSQIPQSQINDGIHRSCSTPIGTGSSNHQTPFSFMPDAGKPLAAHTTISQYASDLPSQRQLGTPLQQSMLNSQTTPNKRQLYSMYTDCNSASVKCGYTAGHKPVSSAGTDQMSPVPQMSNVSTISPVSMWVPEARYNITDDSASNLNTNSTSRVVYEPSSRSPHAGKLVDSCNTCTDDRTMPKRCVLSLDDVGMSTERSVTQCPTNNPSSAPTPMHIRSDVNDIQEEPRNNSPLAVQQQVSVDVPEPEDVFLPDTQHTLEMFSQEAGLVSPPAEIKATAKLDDKELTGAQMSNMLMPSVEIKDCNDHIEMSTRPQADDVGWNQPSTNETRKKDVASYTSTCCLTQIDAGQDRSFQEELCKTGDVAMHNLDLIHTQGMPLKKHQDSVTKKRERKPLISQAPRDTCITPFSFSQCQTSEEMGCLKDERCAEVNQEENILYDDMNIQNNEHVDSRKQLVSSSCAHVNTIQQNLSCNDKSDMHHTYCDSREQEFNSGILGRVECSRAKEALSTVDRVVDSQVENSIGYSRAQATSRIGTSLLVGSYSSPTARSQHKNCELGPDGVADSFSDIPASSKTRPIVPCSTSNRMVVSQSSRGFVRPVTSAPRVAKGFQTPTLSSQGHSQRNVCGEFFFPSSEEVQDCAVPQRQVRIPVVFPNAAMYKQVMIGALKEHLNIILFKLAHQYHTALSKVDITGYTGAVGSCPSAGQSQSSSTSNSPPCEHGAPTKMVCVKKEGPNKGRFFYVCSSPRGNQCKFFMWADQHKTKSSNNSNQSGNSNQSRQQGLALSDPGSITTYFKSHHVALYCQCELLKKSMNSYGSLPGVPAWVRKYKQQQPDSGKKRLYLKLSHKGPSSTYAKDDLWIISSEMTFHPNCTFLAKSIYHGPSSVNEIEIEPVSRYCPSNWTSTVMVHGLHVGNASTEFTCISNIEEYINVRTLPILPYILNGNENEDPDCSMQTSGFRTPSCTQTSSRSLNYSQEQVMHLAEEMIHKYRLNTDQGEAVQRVAAMFSNDAGSGGDPITLIHGVFGAGKSFLLAVTVLFLIQLFELSDRNAQDAGSHTEWKLLIASTTNVAVDRILLGLLELGFEEFIRVGSVRKIAKPVLPYSVHAADKEKQELKELQEMLKTDLTPSEKQLVRKSIDRHRLGKNKELLSRVRVVGVTCAACTFQSLSCLKFPVVMLDECSQMTEPASLLPIARFECEKLVLVGDPKQLDPTIQGSEPAHNASLEQTLFDRLLLMGSNPILLRTQYRCHPRISAISSSLFYENRLMDGVSEEDRPSLIDGLPTLCIYNVSNGQEVCASDGSFYNDQEASFVVFVIECLLVSGMQSSDIGVITLYKAQMRKIQQMLLSSGIDKANEMKSIQISTVDAFQGGEKGIIILSSVRTDYMGFADSDKRTNVALTRAKNHLLIVGNLKILTENSLWSQVVEKCQEYRDGIQSSQAFTRHWKVKITEIQQAHQEMAESQKKTSTARKKTANVTESDQRKTKRKKLSPCKEMESAADSESKMRDVLGDVSEENMPGFVKSSTLAEQFTFSDDDFEDDTLVPGDGQATTQRSNVPSNSSPSYSPLEHVVPSDSSGSESDEDLPASNIGDL